MTMHLERGLTTTSTKKRKVKLTKAQQAELELGWKDRNKRLKEMGLPKETLEQYTEWVYGKGKKEKNPSATNTKCSPSSSVVSFGRHPNREKAADINTCQETEINTSADKTRNIWVTGPCASKPAPVYTGSKIIGIGTMHKSNAVPIFSDDEAKDISSMRR